MQTASGSKLGGMAEYLKNNLTLGAGLHASFKVSKATPATVTTLQCDQHPADEFWVDGSGANKCITVGATDFERYDRATPIGRVESTSGRLRTAVLAGKPRGGML